MQLALGSMDRIVERIPAATKHYVTQIIRKLPIQLKWKKILAAAFQCEIRSRQGRTFLKIGALPEAATTFAAATQLWSSIETRIPPGLINHNLLKTLPIQMKLNAGLIDFADSGYDIALGSFSQAGDLF